MKEKTIRAAMSEMGKRGGAARIKNLTPEQIRESCIKASKAAAEARRKKRERSDV